MDEEKYIDIKKEKEGEIIRVRFNQFRGKDYLDIRNYYTKDGELKPTSKGVSIPIAMAGEVVEAASKVLHT